jgi:GNAT superfamily N-acetyltransferase
MQVRDEPDARRFAEVAFPHLIERSGHNNLPLGIIERIRSGVYEGSRHWVASSAGRVEGVALQTPPHHLILAEPTRAEAVEALVDAIAARPASIPGVVANVPWAERFVRRWPSRAELDMEQGVYELTEVTPPRSATGRPRAATPADRELVVAWIDRFAAEAMRKRHRRDAAETQRIVDLALHGDAGSGFTLWEDDGEPVSLTGHSVFATGARIGPVYTPPARRGRGYASNLVAHVSGERLAGGTPACYLHTDMANPTSNRIYTDVGYRLITRSQEYAFAP